MKLIIFAVLACFSTLAMADGNSLRVIEITGSTAFKIHDKSSQLLQGQEVIGVNDQVKTGKDSTVLLQDDQGAQQALGKNSQLTVLAGDVTSLHLDAGSFIIHVPKVSEPVTKHRLIIRTRTAVMGVRGTTFSVEADAAANGTTTLRTLEGQVEIAKSLSELQSGKVQQVGQNQMILASPNGFSQRSNFDSKVFLASQQNNNPRGASLGSNPEGQQKSNNGPGSQPGAEGQQKSKGPGNGPGNGPGGLDGPSNSDGKSKGGGGQMPPPNSGANGPGSGSSGAGLVPGGGSRNGLGSGPSGNGMGGSGGPSGPPAPGTPGGAGGPGGPGGPAAPPRPKPPQPQKGSGDQKPPPAQQSRGN